SSAPSVKSTPAEDNSKMAETPSATTSNNKVATKSNTGNASNNSDKVAPVENTATAKKNNNVAPVGAKTATPLKTGGVLAATTAPAKTTGGKIPSEKTSAPKTPA